MLTEHLTEQIAEYGYWATFFGTMLEGEAAAFISGVAAHNQWLYYPWVLLFAALGGITSDSLLFTVGYFFGPKILARLPRHQDKITWVQQKITQHQVGLIIGIRFAYGLRTIGPIIIGSAKINPLKFFGFNILGGILWSGIIVTLGYMASSVLIWLPFKSPVVWLVGLVIILLAILMARKFWHKKWRKKPQSSDND